MTRQPADGWAEAWRWWQATVRLMEARGKQVMRAAGEQVRLSAMAT